MSYAIVLKDGRVIDRGGWTQVQAEEYLAALCEQAQSEDGMGDDLEEVFGPVLDDYEAILAGARIAPVPPPADAHHQAIAQDQVRKTLGVQFIGETKRIVVGHVNDAQDSLVGDTEDATNDAVRAVAEHIIHAYDGTVEVEFDDGMIYQIEVVKIGQRHPDGSRYGLHPHGLIVGYGAETDQR